MENFDNYQIFSIKWPFLTKIINFEKNWLRNRTMETNFVKMITFSKDWRFLACEFLENRTRIVVKSVEIESRINFLLRWFFVWTFFSFQNRLFPEFLFSSISASVPFFAKITKIFRRIRQFGSISQNKREKSTCSRSRGDYLGHDSSSMNHTTCTG